MCINHRIINIKNLSRLLINPQVAFDILQRLGFIPCPNNMYYVYQYELRTVVDPQTLLDLYFMNYISAKLFDLAVNRLRLFYVSKPLQQDTDKSGVFVWEGTDPIAMKAKIIHSLMDELLRLPNQHHCCLAQIRLGTKTVSICILNNNGKKYQNIDWQNMDLNKLISDITPYASILQGRTVVNCIEYCVNTDQLIFLKKLIYVLTNSISKAFTWPQYNDEYIMTLLKKYKYDRKLVNNPYFVDNFIRVLCKVEGECSKACNFTHLQSTLDKLIKENVTPKAKSRLCFL